MWLKVCENVADVLRIPLKEVYDEELIYFLNIMSYVNQKNQEIKKKYANPNGVQ